MDQCKIIKTIMFSLLVGFCCMIYSGCEDMENQQQNYNRIKNECLIECDNIFTCDQICVNFKYF